MALTDYQKFVKANYKKYGGDFKKIGAAWRAKKGGKSKSKPKTTSKPASKAKPKPKKKPRGKKERKVDDYKKEFNDWRKALGFPAKSCHFKIIKKSWSLKLGPFRTRNPKLSKAMQQMRKWVNLRV